MGLFFFLRYGIASFAFIAWFIYQKQVKRRHWGELKNDAMAIAFFILVWIGIAYWITS